MPYRDVCPVLREMWVASSRLCFRKSPQQAMQAWGGGLVSGWGGMERGWLLFEHG